MIYICDISVTFSRITLIYCDGSILEILVTQCHINKQELCFNNISVLQHKMLIYSFILSYNERNIIRIVGLAVSRFFLMPTIHNPVYCLNTKEEIPVIFNVLYHLLQILYMLHSVTSFNFNSLHFLYCHNHLTWYLSDII